MAKGLLLLSGGLDSTLAGRILLDLGIEIEAVNFTSPFCRCTPKSFGCSVARAAAERLGIPVRVLAKAEDYLELVKRPKHGRGSGMNPCLDCRIYAFRKAGKLMDETGADFIATGEVLGQRPMSQRRDTIRLIERESGLEGRVVRPLSAKLLPPSLPEQQGLIDRERLLAIQGRSRKTQMMIAEERDVRDYPCPAGGCLLTDPEFAARMRELLEREPEFNIADAKLLSVGRHFRLPGGTKCVIGRNEEENAKLENPVSRPHCNIVPTEISGPTALLLGSPESPDREHAARLIAYHLREKAACVAVGIANPDGDGIPETSNVYSPATEEEVEAWRISVRPVKKVPGSGDLRTVLIHAMREHFGTDSRRIAHAERVLKLAESIQAREGGSRSVVIAAAILHDIGILEAERKHGSNAGIYQEMEGPPIARRFLRDTDIPAVDADHVCSIIANHHTARNIDTLEFRILWDADRIRNIEEDREESNKRRPFSDCVFRTESGLDLARRILKP